MAKRKRAAKNGAVATTEHQKPAEKYPELWGQFEALRAEQAELLAETAPLQKKYDALRNKVAPIEAEMREIAQEIKTIEQPRAGELGRQIAALARAMGASTLVNEGPR